MPLVSSAKGVYLNLQDGMKLIDGMSSWWSAIHGYNVEALNQAANEQLQKMSHVMFGGLTHESAVTLAKKLLSITNENFDHIFFSDSGSVSVEVALKMAFQYFRSQKIQNKTKILAFYKGYHGDTFGAMSVCDPVTGMHTIFSGILHKNIFASIPTYGFDAAIDEKAMQEVEQTVKENADTLAAIIIEPVVQGAGGMRFYPPEFLKKLRVLCDRYGVLLIFDEIATGFGRSGKLFAYEHAGVLPDIMCIGKALTGGYLSLAATLTTNKVIQGVEAGGNVLMHGPTFMANPLACSVANTSIDLLLSSPWQERVRQIEAQLKDELSRCQELSIVKEVRVLGAIGVVELHKPIDLAFLTPHFIKRGVWIRPFLNLVYIMPPYIIEKQELTRLTQAIFDVIQLYQKEN